MDIRKIDKNFEMNSVDGDGMTRYAIPCDKFDLYGVFHDGERFLRMPSETAANVSDGVAYMNKHTSGGRVRFSTNAERIEITVTYDALGMMSHMPLSGSSGFILIDETNENDPKFAGAYFPAPTDAHGFSLCKSVNTAKSMRDYILYMPLYNDVKSLTVGLDEGAKVHGGRKYLDKKPILYYGSSITQGGCASRPDTCYEAIISSWCNVDYVNLGFSGNGKAEQVMADYLAEIDCSVFVCDYDYNAPNANYLEKTHYALYKTFRAHQKDTPILLISKPNPEYDPEGEKRFKIIENTYLTATKNGDKNIYLINGYELYGTKDRHLCAVDNCHPTDLGFSRIAHRLWQTLKPLL